MKLTMGDEYTEIKDYLNACRVKRNVSDYDTADTVSENEVKELIDTANNMYLELKNWLYSNYPEYV